LINICCPCDDRQATLFALPDHILSAVPKAGAGKQAVAAAAAAAAAAAGQGREQASGSDCADQEGDCVGWARAGECDKNPRYLHQHCPKSCGQCPDYGDEATTVTGAVMGAAPASRADTRAAAFSGAVTASTPAVGGAATAAAAGVTLDCQDENASCPAWASSGECEKNPVYLHAKCAKSCGVCDGAANAKAPAAGAATGGPCVDKQAECPVWAAQGECETNPGYANAHCPLSCKQCSAEAGTSGAVGCADLHTDCGGWAKLGDCDKNAKYMHKTCRKAAS